jgi:pyruvate/oxaloacetate carboxyltransferase
MSSQINPAPPKNLVEAATAGGFLLTEEGGKPIMDAVAKVRAELEAHRKTLDQIDREPYLSNTPGGVFVSEHARLVASGDEQSLREVLVQVEKVLDDLETGLSTAMDSYASVELANGGMIEGSSSV